MDSFGVLMAVIIRDTYLEELIDRERQRRRDSTMAKTASDLIREKISELDADLAHQLQESITAPSPSGAKDG